MHYKKKKYGFLVFLLAAAAVVLTFKFGPSAMARLTNSYAHSDASRSVLPAPSAAADSTVPIDTDSLHSPCAILVRLKGNTVLMQKQSDEKIYPASLTKMMTAIVAIENLSNLQKKVELSYSIFHPLYQSDASMAGFQPGERVRAIDLLYGALLPSGAECCMGLADYISDSEQGFVRQMNLKAEKLGMNHTHFMNPTGLQDKNHYTTVKDLSVLLSYALRNQTFRDIFTSSSHSTASTNKHPDGITFKSTLFENLKSRTIPNGEILGGKTGYTDDAGLCLASLARINGEDYILVTAGAKGDHKTEQYDIDDAREVYQELQ